ncbi:MAG TPA: integrase arm-type DNA-binding domain-containing protein [Stellaceae bacterium]|nr:integrase arm-type DNA-binding domain-containing protein [Stellaceae bacterium]
MPRGSERLSARRVETIKRPGRYADGKGLYLKVAPTGSKSWQFRFTIAGRTRYAGLGPYPAISLAEAREKAAAQRILRLQGQDPIEARRAVAAGAQSFEACARAYYDAHKAKWRSDRYREHWWRELELHVLPHFGQVSVDAISLEHILKAFRPFWEQHPNTAQRNRGRVEAILGWATIHGYRSGDNPARWRGYLEHAFASRAKGKTHYPAMPYRDIPAFIAELQKHESVWTRALQFLILTCSRTKEVRFAEWSEIDIRQLIWTIPAERMKPGREHRVPITRQALYLCTLGSRWLFSAGGQPIATTALRDTMLRMGYGQYTPHGFRSSFRDWAAEQTEFPREVAELALSHWIGAPHELAYRRTDFFERRRRLAEEWAAYCFSS